MTNKVKKTFVLSALFLLPLLLYIFISSGVNNFGRLPILSENVIDVSEIDSAKTTTFKRNISIVVFLGEDIESVKGGFFNLNQKIYKPFYGFKDFQLVAVYPNDKKEDVLKLKQEIGKFTDLVKWKFIGASAAEIEAVYESFSTNDSLTSLYVNKAFIIDKEGKLRGRVDDKESVDGKLYGYNMHSVAELNNKMKDDVKVVLAEYRLALKKNNADREI
ncbi:MULTISPECIES: hypothetical protein [Tenacibaculum]|uniref:hypothetical protein n=1 Tax=Tenacibaculum TaxID=104267 RepID=UPI001F0A6E34|nr:MULTISPECIES: hypothetical protein [Tenacibaculum]MCH3881073.1 hypothetical protein [Tenacibaculum aquimarinum]MDO6599327.1 hypothetical protein [Tenacibaculum sp. 1_MG-2023]